jgi:hypothetical protein
MQMTAMTVKTAAARVRSPFCRQKAFIRHPPLVIGDRLLRRFRLFLEPPHAVGEPIMLAVHRPQFQDEPNRAVESVAPSRSGPSERSGNQTIAS